MGVKVQKRKKIDVLIEYDKNAIEYGIYYGCRVFADFSNEDCLKQKIWDKYRDRMLLNKRAMMNKFFLKDTHKRGLRCLAIPRIIIRLRATPSFCTVRKSETRMDRGLHIGNIIKAEMAAQGRKSSWLAEQLNCTRINVYKPYERKSIDTDQLAKISEALDSDFFKYYQEKYRQRSKSKEKDDKGLGIITP